MVSANHDTPHGHFGLACCFFFFFYSLTQILVSVSHHVFGNSRAPELHTGKLG